MERLTRKSLEYKDTWIADGSLSNIEGVVRGKAIDRLAELEDILEKYGIENLEDLELRLEDIEHYAYQANKQLIDILTKYGIENLDILDLNLQTIKNINIQNANLRNELAELKQKAIVQKFKIGQDVFIILDAVIKETNINSITIFAGNELSYYCKYVNNEKMYLELDEEEIFATREEAGQKLAETKGEKDD